MARSQQPVMLCQRHFGRSTDQINARGEAMELEMKELEVATKQSDLLPIYIYIISTYSIYIYNIFIYLFIHIYMCL